MRPTFRVASPLVVLAVAVLGLAACGRPAGAEGTLIAEIGEPKPCEDVYAPPRCALIELATAVQLGVPLVDISAAAIIPAPTYHDTNGNTILMTLGGGAPLDVRVTMADGTTSDLYVGCGGVDMRPFCTDEPSLRANDLIGSGYHDVPCAGEPPDGCATPLPPPAPAALTEAVELRIDQLDIPIDHVGDYRVRVGEARLPSGWVSEASFAFADTWPADVTILSSQGSIELESLESDGRPFDNVYSHGWREDAERVAAYLVFHVDAFEPGAILAIKDVILR